jgi:hypothetical protein
MLCARQWATCGARSAPYENLRVLRAFVVKGVLDFLLQLLQRAENQFAPERFFFFR